MKRLLVTHLPASLLIAFLAFLLAACGGGGDGGSVSGATPPPSPAVVITGTVPGTVAIAYDFATGKEAARSVASGTPKTFSLNLDLGTYYLMFIENEGTSSQRSFSFRNVTGENLFTFTESTTLDLGALNFSNFQYMGSATPQIDPISGNSHVREAFMPEAAFSPGDGAWTATKTFVNSTCFGHSPGMTVTENVKIAHGFGIVTYTPDGTSDTAVGVANVNTAILTDKSSGPLVTIVLTMQSDGSLAGTYRKAGECSEEATITAVLGTSPPGPAVALTALTISGPATMSEYVTATYSATATWNDGSMSTVTPTWSVNSPMASITGKGVLFFAQGVDKDMIVTVSATYATGGATKAASMDVTIDHWTPYMGAPFPLTAHWVSGRVFFEERTVAGGGYESSLYRFDAGSSFQQYVFKNPPDTSESFDGTWSIGGSGELILTYAGGKTVTVVAFDDLVYRTMVSIDDGSGDPYAVDWEPSGPGLYPFRAVLQGTYVNQYGDTWTFNSNGTGSTTGDGGWTFTWSITGGVLQVVFPNGYVGVMYERCASRPTMDESIIRWAFVIYAPTGGFGAYYGGMALVPQ